MGLCHSPSTENLRPPTANQTTGSGLLSSSPDTLLRRKVPRILYYLYWVDILMGPLLCLLILGLIDDDSTVGVKNISRDVT